MSSAGGSDDVLFELVRRSRAGTPSPVMATCRTVVSRGHNLVIVVFLH